MTDLAALFANAYRDYKVDGIASSGLNEPAKPDLRALGPAIASEILSRYQAPVTGVQSRTLTTPPVSPPAGQRWIVPPGATGPWSGQNGKVAEWTGSAYSFTAPTAVFSAYVLDEAQLYGYDGTAWKILTGASLGFPTVAAMALVTTAAANIRAIVEQDIIGRTASRARSSNVATIVMQSAHGLTTGAKINVRNLGASAYNADQLTITVINSTTYTYANSGGDESTTADTAGQADRNGTYVCDGAGGWTWNGDPLLDPAIAAQLGKATTIAADITALATLTQYVTTTGTLSATDANWRSSPMLQAAPGEVYTFSGLGNTAVSSITFYDSAIAVLETHVSSSVFTAYSGSFTAPVGTVYARICYGLLGGIPATVTVGVSGTSLWEASRAKEAIELIGHVTKPGYVNTSGALVADVNWVNSEYIAVSPSAAIVYRLWGHPAVRSLSFYTSAKAFISAVVAGGEGAFRATAIAPSNAAYMRVSTGADVLTSGLVQSVGLLATLGDLWAQVLASSSSFTIVPFKAPRRLKLLSTDKVILYGDSISSTDYAGYQAAMADLTGATVYAGGFSGYSTAQLAANAQLQRIWDYGPRLIVALVGGNDTGAAGTVGTFGADPSEPIVAETDVSGNYSGTYFIQAVSHIIRKINAQYYNIRARAGLTGSENEAARAALIDAVLKPAMVFATTLPQKRNNSSDAFSQPDNWERKRRAVVECCDKYQVHCVDLTLAMALDMSLEPYWTAPTDMTNNNGVWLMDGLHPNKYGYRRMSEIICADFGL